MGLVRWRFDQALAGGGAQQRPPPNYLINNALTFRFQTAEGSGPLLRGLLKFLLVASLPRPGERWVVASAFYGHVSADRALGPASRNPVVFVWNYAGASSRFRLEHPLKRNERNRPA